MKLIVLILFLLFIKIDGRIGRLEEDDFTGINWVHCGERPLIHDELPHKIVGGQESLKGDWPWQIALTYNNRLICGGSIINSYWVVTAAHCVYSSLDPSRYKIISGLHDTNAHDSFTDVKSVSKIIVHPGYSNFGYRNDIALIKLSERLIFNDYIMPVCIPDLTFNLTNQDGIAIGWRSKYSGGPISRYLMEVELPILTDTKCKEKYQSVETTTAICAGDNGSNFDTCEGDSGGPLVVGFESDHDHDHDHKSDDEHEHEHDHDHDHVHLAYYLVGITSWGYGCGDGGVYTRTSAYKNWISEIVKNN